jgi:signal recognition particle subunit SRP54
MDAMMGQSAKRHAEAFSKALPLTGIILTKLDGGAKGGGALAAYVSLTGDDVRTHPSTI